MASAWSAHGVAHVGVLDLETLAYAHALDNVCQTVQQLATIRGERSLYFGRLAGPAALKFDDPASPARSTDLASPHATDPMELHAGPGSARHCG